MNYSTLSLRTRLVAITGVVVLLSVLALSAFNVLTARNAALTTLGDQSHALARAHAEAIAEWVADRSLVVQSTTAAATAAEPLPILQQAEKAGGFDTT
jgi:methyl-accepting chemotaxis protein